MLLYRNRHVLQQIPRTAAQCAGVLIRSNSTTSAGAPAPSSSDPSRTKTDTDNPADAQDEAGWKAQGVPQQPASGAVHPCKEAVPKGMVFDKETGQLRPRRKSGPVPGTKMSTLVKDAVTGEMRPRRRREPGSSTVSDLIFDKKTKEWRPRKIGSGRPKSLRPIASSKPAARPMPDIVRDKYTGEMRPRLKPKGRPKRANGTLLQHTTGEKQIPRGFGLDPTTEELVPLPEGHVADLVTGHIIKKRSKGRAPGSKQKLQRTCRDSIASDVAGGIVDTTVAENGQVVKTDSQEQMAAEGDSAPEKARKAEATTNKKSSIAKASTKPKASTKDKSAKQPKPKVRRATAPETLDGASDSQEQHVTRQLENVGPWVANPGKRRGRPPAHITDYNRVNIISESLCDDIIKYMDKSLDRHNGCDLLDLNPGVGIWSQKLHERLQPRKHILMEPDAETYQPFMKDFLGKPNVELINKPGVLWTNLTEALDSHFPHQKVVDKAAPKERNDTLLVTANIGWWPKKSLYASGIGLMILYQLIHAIHTSTLVQKYGNVRMLVWVDDGDKSRLLPRSNFQRRRFGFEAELACEYIHEVAAPRPNATDFQTRRIRDGWLDVESNAATLQRMRAQGLTIPEHRMPDHHREILGRPELVGQRLAGERPPAYRRNWLAELEKLQSMPDGSVPDDAAKEAQHRRLVLLDRVGKHEADGILFLEMLQRHDAALAARGTPEFPALTRHFMEGISTWNRNHSNQFDTILDNYRAFRHPDGPQLLWDRRALEPLLTHAPEFFPNVPLALVDVQPKAMHPLLTQYGPGTTRSGDMSDLLLRPWFAVAKSRTQEAMTAIWHGFGEDEVYARCPSLRDPARGGVPREFDEYAPLRVRNTTEEHWLEVVQAWMEWPFRPDYVEMVGKGVSSAGAEEDAEEV